MAEVKAQKVRRVMVEVVSSYDDTIVTRTALEDSDKFKEFLNKAINLDFATFDQLDFDEVIMEMENHLHLVIPDRSYATWKTLFDQINLLMD